MGKLHGESLDRRFFHRLGASLLDRTICATAGAAGCDITLGTRAMVGLAASAKANGKGLSDVRLAYFGVGNTPLRARKAEAALAGGDVDAAVKALAADLDPPDDVQATGATKRHLAGVLLRRVAKQLMGAGA